MGKKSGCRISLKDAEKLMSPSAFAQVKSQLDSQAKLDKKNKTINKIKSKAKKLIREEDTPEYKLYEIFKDVFEPEYQVTQQDKLIPGRRFSVDIGVLSLKLCGELDGYMHHGFNKDGFKRDRIKDRLHIIEGYQIVRFFASEVLEDPAQVKYTLLQIKRKRIEILKGQSGIFDFDPCYF